MRDRIAVETCKSAMLRREDGAEGQLTAQDGAPFHHWPGPPARAKVGSKATVTPEAFMMSFKRLWVRSFEIDMLRG